jgi:DNA-binding NarL/FixJ family response regulator
LEVETPGGQEDVIQVIGRDRPEIVIFDLKMPNMDGLEVVRRIRREASLFNCIIFVLTSNPGEDGQVAAAGATGYRVSNTVKDLSRAIKSAIEARSSLSDQV